MSHSNLDSTQKIEVSLMGQKFTLRSDRDEAYIAELSRLVNVQMEQIKASTKMASPQSLALLAALNLADELARAKESLSLANERLFFEKKEFEELKEELRKKSEAALQQVQTALSYLPDDKNEPDNSRNEDKGPQSDSHPYAKY